MKEQLLQFWRARAPRERWIIGAAAAFLIVALADVLIWQPLVKSRDRLRSGVPELRIAAAQMRTDAAEAARLKAGARAETSASLIANLTQSAEAAGLREKITDIREVDDKRVSVTLPSVAFESWITWLAQVRAQYGASIDVAQVEALPESGMVKVQAVFTSG